MYFYNAFEMNIASEIKISLLKEEAPCRPDVTIVRESRSYLDELLDRYKEALTVSESEGTKFWSFKSRDVIGYNVKEGISFIIEKTDKISVITEEDKAEDGLLAVYLLGGCMGVILHRQGKIPIHGSCVSKDGEALIIMGDTGAGKSTTARAFLSHGRKLVTDDVSVIDFEDGTPVVIPSYPSQKLWEDAIASFDIDKESQTPLYQEERKEKFNVSVGGEFENKRTKLKYAVCLIKGKENSDLVIKEVRGLAVSGIFMNNIYRPYFREKERKNELFQACVDLSEKVKLFEVVRPENRDTCSEIYEKINSLICGKE